MLAEVTKTENEMTATEDKVKDILDNIDKLMMPKVKALQNLDVDRMADYVKTAG